MPNACLNACLVVAVRLAAIVAWVAAVALSRPPAAAAEPATVVVVFDGSGSMWGRPDGQRESKLVMAREGIGHGLAKLVPGTRVGLVSFGHRRGGDCQDTETIIEPAPFDVERVMTTLERLNPRGRGPITKALGEATALLGSRSAPARIVLIHDGLDNCQQDPCSVLPVLKAAHPGARVDVISLGLPADEARTMSCLTQATGGKQYIVSAAADIDAALLESVGKAADATAPPPTPAPVPRASAPPPSGASRALPPSVGTSTRPGLQLWATLVKEGPPIAAPIVWRIRPLGEKGPPLWEGKTAAPLLVLPTGRYDVEASIGLITRTGIADAAEGKPRALTIVLDAGLLSLSQTDATAAMLDEAQITLTRIEGKGPGEPQILRRIEPELALPAGNYLVSITTGAMRIERPVGVVAGERVSLANSLSLGALELSATAVRGGTRLDELVYAIFEDDPDAPQGRREVARSAAAEPRFKLPAGTYYVVARRGSAEARDRVSVRSGEVERHTMVLEAGRVALAVKLAGGRQDGDTTMTHRLERLDVQPREVITASGPAAVLELAAGQYRLESRVGSGNVRAEREIRLKAGDTERISIEHAAGVARFRMVDRATGNPLPDVSFEVRNRNGEPVWAGLGSEPRTLLLAGRYKVRAEARGTMLERDFDVTAGEDRLVEIAPR